MVSRAWSSGPRGIDPGGQGHRGKIRRGGDGDNRGGGGRRRCLVSLGEVLGE